MREAPKKKILVIEDEKPMARALELKLTRAGFGVTTLDDGEKVVETITTGQFDLILMDLMMPRCDGYCVLQKLSQNNIKTPVIVLTNLGQEEDERRARDAGVADYLVKSNTPLAKIVESVENFLKK